MLGDNALQVQFADPLKQRDAAAVNVIDVAQRTLDWYAREETTEFLLPLQQLMTASENLKRMWEEGLPSKAVPLPS